MLFSSVFQRLLRRIVLVPSPASVWRFALLSLRGAHIGKGTTIPPLTMATWPHQIQLGEKCILQPGIFFNYDHYWTPGPSIIIGDRVFIGRGTEFNIQGRIEVGNDALIASGCVFVDHDHALEKEVLINLQANHVRPIEIGCGAWIGTSVVVLKGVSIGKGAVVGAGSIVTKSVPDGEIWAGNPAKLLKRRPANIDANRSKND